MNNYDLTEAMQTELINKLQKVAEYDGLQVSLFPNIITPIAVFKDDGWIEPKYHTSFDWSVPVFSKAIKELATYATDVINEMELTLDYIHKANIAVVSNNPQAFFDNLYNLIVEIEKFKTK